MTALKTTFGFQDKSHPWRLKSMLCQVIQPGPGFIIESADSTERDLLGCCQGQGDIGFRRCFDIIGQKLSKNSARPDTPAVKAGDGHKIRTQGVKPRDMVRGHGDPAVPGMVETYPAYLGEDL